MGHLPGVRHTNKKFSDEVRIGAVADYLIGRSLSAIYCKWGVSGGMLHYWLCRCPDFKRRNAQPRKVPKRVLLPRVVQFSPPADRIDALASK